MQDAAISQPKDSSSSRNAIQYCGSIIANCCDSAEKQALLGNINMELMILGLLEIDTGKIIETALDLLAALTRDNPKAVNSIRNASRRIFPPVSLVTF